MLTKKVFLNALASFLDYGARVGVVLVTTPIVIHMLGASLFGVWQMLTRMGEHLAPSDGRASDALRWIIAEKQADSEAHAKRRALASALIVWTRFLPFFLLLGAALAWLSPRITNVAPEHYTVVRLAMGLVVVSTMFSTLKTFSGGVLFGQNLAHKNMGVMAGTTLLGGVLIVIAIHMGWGLPGLAMATAISMALGAIVSYRVAKRHVPWYGLEKPAPDEVKRTLRLSGWFVAWTFVENALIGADIMVLGYVASSGLVARYVVTAYGFQTITMVILTSIAAAMPGLGSVLSRGEVEKARLLRDETITYTWLLGMIVGATILLCNPSFVRLWVGPGQYAGDLENLMIVVVTLQLVLIRVDATIINLALDMRKKVFLGAGAAIFSIALSILLIPNFGIAGLCAALIAGRLVLSVAYPRIVHGFLQDGRKGRWRQWTRILVTAIAMSSIAWISGRHLIIKSWMELLVMATASVSISAGIVYWIALTDNQRTVLAGRVRSLID